MRKLSSIAPIWAQRIKDWRMDLEILRDPKQCIVGEAWRYSNYYIVTCNKCEELGGDFYCCAHDSDPLHLRFMRTVQKFETHFSKEHLPK